MGGKRNNSVVFNVVSLDNLTVNTVFFYEMAAEISVIIQLMASNNSVNSTVQSSS